MADNLATFMCRLSRNLAASTPETRWTCKRPVQGLLDPLPFTGNVCCVRL